jgi:hypothetical protein
MQTQIAFSPAAAPQYRGTLSTRRNRAKVSKALVLAHGDVQLARIHAARPRGVGGQEDIAAREFLLDLADLTVSNHANADPYHLASLYTIEGGVSQSW